MSKSLGIKEKKRRGSSKHKTAQRNKKKYIKDNLSLAIWKDIRDKVLEQDDLIDCPELKFKIHKSSCIARVLIEEHICDKVCTRCTRFNDYIDVIYRELKNNGI